MINFHFVIFRAIRTTTEANFKCKQRNELNFQTKQDEYFMQRDSRSWYLCDYMFGIFFIGIFLVNIIDWSTRVDSNQKNLVNKLDFMRNEMIE